jgi:hypothetical protein
LLKCDYCYKTRVVTIALAAMSNLLLYNELMAELRPHLVLTTVVNRRYGKPSSKVQEVHKLVFGLNSFKIKPNPISTDNQFSFLPIP